MFTNLLGRLEKNPVLSFILVLITLFGVIILSNSLRAPKEATALPEPTVKTSRLFEVGIDESQMTVSAQVKKSDTVNIVALAPGIVQSLAVRPGQLVGDGQTVATLTTDYASGSSALSRERTALQADLVERTYAIEKDIIEIEKKIAKSDSSKTDREEGVALKSLKLELERLKLRRETARIDLALAERSDAVLRPKSLVRGTIEYIAVRPGDLVSAGTVLMTLHASPGQSTLEAAFPKKLADALAHTGIARFEQDHQLHLLSQSYQAKSETTTGLIMATYPLPEKLAATLAQHDYVTLTVPLVPEYKDGYLVPIDAIHSASTETSVVVMGTDHLTQSKTVTLGETIGASVVVKSGISRGDQIVLNTAVLPGEKIEPIR